MRFEKLDAISKRVVREKSSTPFKGRLVDDVMTLLGERSFKASEIANYERYVGFPCRLESRVDAEMQLTIPKLKPAAAPPLHHNWLGNLDQPEKVAEETPRFVFTARRNRDLNVIENRSHGDLHHADVGCVLGLHSNHVVAGIDMVDFTGHTT